MGIATKSRRKITVKDQKYLWYVAEDYEAAGAVTLYVISTDKHFIIKYQIGQPKGEEYIVILGRRFAGAKTGGPWRRFLCPRFADKAVTPQSVRQLIEWCLDESLARQEIDWRGQLVDL